MADCSRISCKAGVLQDDGLGAFRVNNSEAARWSDCTAFDRLIPEEEGPTSDSEFNKDSNDTTYRRATIGSRNLNITEALWRSSRMRKRKQGTNGRSSGAIPCKVQDSLATRR